MRLDRLYTSLETAARLYATFRRFYGSVAVLMVKLSAGDGSFLKLLLPGSLGFNLVPVASGI